MKKSVAIVWVVGGLSLCACSPPSDQGAEKQTDPGAAEGLGGQPPFDPGTDDVVTVPDLGPRVLLFDPSMDMVSVQAQIDAVADAQDSRDNEFGPNRYALLFQPGTYDLNVRAGYYTQVAGLGLSPGEVVVNGGVESRQVRDTALSNFWRSAENLTVIPADGSNIWAASQASPLRRIHVVGNLDLSEAGYTSGGFLADSKIDGTVRSGTQQQFFSRNTIWDQWFGGVWNMMFVGASNPPAGQWPQSPYTVIEKTPLVREKPFLYIDQEGAYHVFVPSFTMDTIGTSWEQSSTPGESIPINSFYVAHEDTDSAATINAALASGKHLLVTPGKYYLSEAIEVSRAGTVVLGLGFPSFVPTAGSEAMTVADVDDVIIAGMTFDAGPQNSPTLLRVGDPASVADHSGSPTLLSDVFCRVGTSDAGVTSSCVTINSNDVVADHFWLWRADHGPSATDGRPGWSVNESPNGLVVSGHNVTIYGLFNEHFQEYQTVWNGDGGRVYFYQCEMPYDPPDQASWSHDGVDGYAAYKVADEVSTHEAWGLGVYCTFQAAPVFAESAIEVPDAPGVKMHHMTTFWLSGLGGGIRNVINQSGGEAVEGNQQGIIDEYPLP